MKFKFKITADDFGLTKGITDSILETVDFGAVNSVSILANGGAVEYAVSEYKKRKDKLKIAIHLNLTEGLCLSPKEEISLLVDNRGIFKNSFVSIWLKYIFSFSKKRQNIRRQIRGELSLQIRKIKNMLEENISLRIDGHQHVHMLPFVFDEVLTLIREYNISSIRTSTEPLSLPYLIGSGSISGMIKNLLLNCLERYNKVRLRLDGTETNDHILGVLHTGKMTERAINDGLQAISKIAPEGASVEIIFHPGISSKGETIWDKPLGTDPWHSSPWRIREQETLKSKSLKDLVQKFRR